MKFKGIIHKITIGSENDFIKTVSGTIFHCTTEKNFEGVKQDGYLKVNPGNQFQSPFGCYDSYFRSEGCVSFFDYRDVNSEEWANNAYKCWPLRRLNSSQKLVLLVLYVNEYSQLIHWTKCKPKWEEDRSKMIVPHVELGFPGNVSLSLISKCIVLEDKRPRSVWSDFED